MLPEMATRVKGGYIEPFGEKRGAECVRICTGCQEM